MRRATRSLATALFCLAATDCVRAEDFPSDQVDFFEKKIRPVLVQECYECHSDEAGKSKGGLKLDTREALRKGGESGAVLVPGKSGESLLIAALRHQSPEMPPKKKLPQEVIENFSRWIDQGATDPREDKAEAPSLSESKMDIEKGRQHWAFQAPIKKNAPHVRDVHWVRTPVDHFILAELEGRELRPVGPASKRELIRRATFDLTGLPPTPEEVKAFETDSSPDAFAKLVDRLLESPHYGERWARYWLDVARYAEDQAHTFGVKPNDQGFRYRDWVIQAFNSDMPYNDFVRRQIAIDQFENLSEENRPQIAALGFFGLGAVYYKNSDKAKAAADELDDRIDTLTRGFLGLTVSCARCHDHKFDPIPTQDYYSLAGVFQSSKLMNAPLAPMETVKAYDAGQARIKGLESDLKNFLNARKSALVEESIPDTARYILAVWRQRQKTSTQAPVVSSKDPRTERLDESFVKQWAEALSEKNAGKIPALAPWFEALHKRNPGVNSIQTAHGAGAVSRTLDSVTIDPIPVEIEAAANAIQQALESAVEKRDGVPRSAKKGKKIPERQSAKYASAILQGDLREADIDLDITGASRLHLIVTDAGDGIRSDHGLWCEPRLIGPAGEKRLTELPWRSAQTAHGSVKLNGNFDGSPLKIGDKTYAYGLGTHASAEVVYDLPEGYTRFQSKVGLAGKAPGSVQFRVYFGPPVDLESFTVRSGARSAESKEAEVFLKDFLGEKGLLMPSDKELEGLLTEEDKRKQAEIKTAQEQARKEAPAMYPVAHVITEANPADMKVFIRGNPARTGEVAPRRFLRVLCEGEPQKFSKGSGRVELADAIANPKNPLTARVIVNRIWQRHFGKGLVATPSNFGTLGEKPSHPELLDYLAVTFMEKGWSIKSLHRELMLSATYQLSSAPNPTNEAVDADNRFLWRMNRTRLDIESWRDALLAVSGRLDTQMGGPSLALSSADNKRRTVYSKISRHELDSLLRMFDFPDANITSDKRTETTVPQQQLFVINSPFMLQQARAFAARILQNKDLTDTESRIHHAFRLAFGRAAFSEEMELLLKYLQSEDPEQVRSENSLSRWERLAQNILASNEFMYID